LSDQQMTPREKPRLWYHLTARQVPSGQPPVPPSREHQGTAPEAPVLERQDVPQDVEGIQDKPPATATHSKQKEREQQSGGARAVGDTHGRASNRRFSRDHSRSPNSKEGPTNEVTEIHVPMFRANAGWWEDKVGSSCLTELKDSWKCMPTGLCHQRCRGYKDVNRAEFHCAMGVKGGGRYTTSPFGI